jgi:hypothetical protein
MLNEDDETSLSFCHQRFGHYGNFATLQLCTAIVAADKEIAHFVSDLEYSRCNPASSAKLYESIQDFGFEDANYFTIDEYRFLMLIADSPCLPLSSRQIESDRLVITRELKQQKRIIRSDAEMLLKAVAYWELRYNEKYQAWLEKFSAADEESRIRRLASVRRTQMAGMERDVVQNEII